MIEFLSTIPTVTLLALAYLALVVQYLLLTAQVEPGDATQEYADRESLATAYAAHESEAARRDANLPPKRAGQGVDPDLQELRPLRAPRESGVQRLASLLRKQQEMFSRHQHRVLDKDGIMRRRSLRELRGDEPESGGGCPLIPR